MDTNHLLDLLKKYSHHYPDEKNKVEQTLRFIQNHKDCFYKSSLQGHITTSAWVVDTSGAKALLTHHKKIGTWVQLGGHVEKEDQGLYQAARREVVEESGLTEIKLLRPEIFDLGVYEIPPYESVPKHIHYDITFLFQSLENSENISMSDESHDLKWFSLTGLLEGPFEDSVKRMAKKYLVEKK